jgi:glycosyltransferase involved in cell wall biosynthesis
MKILMLSATFPYPPTRGGTQVRTFNLLKYLSPKHQITLVTQREAGVTDPEIEALRQWVQELQVFPPSSAQASGRGTIAKLQRFGQFLWGGTPPSVLHRYSPEIQTWLDRYLTQNPPDVITCEHCVNEIYIRPQWQQHYKTVVNIHSSVYGTCRNQLQTKTAEKPLREALNLPLLYRYEKAYCAKFSEIVVTTQEDQTQIQKLSPGTPITILPNGVDLEKFPYRSQDPGGYHLAFMGAMDNLANIDAACFLAQTIFPPLKARYPQVTLALVGSRPVAAIQNLAQPPDIMVTGRVDAMVDYLHQTTICVIPMRTGFGIKNKTLEAMAAGTPVVASDRGLEGLVVDQPNQPLRALRANQPEEFVNAIGRLLEDVSLRQKLSANGRAWIEAEYTWEIAGQHYEAVLQRG